MRTKVLNTLLLAPGALALATGAVTSVAEAQAPDIRNIRPAVMLLVDTSGSMQYSSTGATGELPVCSGSPATSTRDRWTTVVEALTGTWGANFYCDAVDRTTYGALEPDASYYLPFNRPPSGGQNADGVLDTYLERVKFGLMTYDNVFGLLDPTSPSMTPGRNAVHVPGSFGTSAFDTLAVGPRGDYSYGPRRPVMYPGCGEMQYVNGGARRIASPWTEFAGGLQSVGDGTASEDYRVINAQIQQSLLTVRPYGATPTAALLDDFRVYLQTDLDVAAGAGSSGDPYASCRKRYAILLTDGAPSDPFRDTANCQAAGSVCPYELSESIADDLCQVTGSATDPECTGILSGGLFVVGFKVADPAAQATLNLIAMRGGTEQAYWADQLHGTGGLLDALGDVLDQAASGTTTRTAPAFAAGASTTSQSQFQFNTGFKIDEDGEGWSGVLDRTRYVCDPMTQQPVAQPISVSEGDDFAEALNRRDLGGNRRRIFTVAPADPANTRARLIGNDANVASITSGDDLEYEPPTTPNGTLEDVDYDQIENNTQPEHFGLTTPTERNALLDWLQGSTRPDRRLGDIYHSTPATVGIPTIDIADEWYKAWRRLPDVAGRIPTIYVGTNDGLLHAFAMEARPAIGSMPAITAGQELWAFVPPTLLRDLPGASVSHRAMVDASPVVQEVYLRRQPGDAVTANRTDPSAYRTVLVMGLREGGNAYIALDVTNPWEPEFLWQFTEARMGQTFARPAIGQVLVDIDGVVQERAVAILPGGRGEIDVGVAGMNPGGCMRSWTTNPTTPYRAGGRCWTTQGRQLHVVDIATGVVLKTFDDSSPARITAPLTGGVAAYLGSPGTGATRAFVTDDDGVMWRLDLSSRNRNDWSFTPFHDIFGGSGPGSSALAGQPAYEPAVLSTDAHGKLVIIQGTGNVDQLESVAFNRVVSLTEDLSFVGTSGTGTANALLNWEIRLREGEQVTGPIALFDSTAYFGTFESQSSSDACNIGQSRLWGVGFGAPTTPSGPASGYTPTAQFPAPRTESVEGSGLLDAHFTGPYGDEIIMGVGVVRQMSCAQTTATSDPYFPFQVASTGGGGFQMVAQVSGRQGAPGSPGASSVRTITRNLPTPASFTRITGWVPQADL